MTFEEDAIRNYALKISDNDEIGLVKQNFKISISMPCYKFKNIRCIRISIQDFEIEIEGRSVSELFPGFRSKASFVNDRSIAMEPAANAAPGLKVALAPAIVAVSGTAKLSRDSECSSSVRAASTALTADVPRPKRPNRFQH